MDTRKKDYGVYVGARMDRELRKRFEEAAKRDSRSLSGALIVAAKDYIEKVTGGKP